MVFGFVISNRQMKTVFLLMMIPLYSSTQSVYLPATHPVYRYLDKMEAKQIITGYRDAVKPLSRQTIARFLITIDTTSMTLTDIESEEQFFFKEEFFQELERLGYENIIEERWHLYQYKSEPGDFNFDLLGGYSYRKRADGSFTKVVSNGIQAYGYAGSSVGLSMMFRDNTESGSSTSGSNPLSPDPAQVIGRVFPTFINYDLIDAQVNFDLDFVTISAEKGHNVWGEGEFGNVILSNKAPSFPQIKLHARLGKNIDFTYLHGWLYSDVIDSARSYSVPGISGNLAFRRINRQKYIAAHMIEFSPWKGVDLAIGESQIYGSRNPELLYLIPVMYFKAGEHWMYDTDNSQMFLTADLNLVKNQNYYLSLFIDEFSTEDFIYDDRQHNQLGFTAGTRLYDTFFPDTRIFIEYTRMNPWVYNHRFSDATYQSHQINLGHWIGQNADLFSVAIAYRPERALELGVQFESLRKGGKDSTTLQYRLPTPTFLYGPMTKMQSFGLFGTYEPMRDFIVDFRIFRRLFTTDVTATSYSFVNSTNEYIVASDYSARWDLYIGFRYNFD